LINVENGELITKIDVAFPVLHGPFGEDGTVQGLLKLAGIPFVGSDVLGSAVGMDKDVMKRLLRDAGLPIGKFITLKNEKIEYQKAVELLGSPLFVKPANMGSSIGVSKIASEVEYLSALSEASRHDEKIILEQYIEGREIECAILGNESLQASALGEIVSNTDFYSYESKYIDSQGANLEAPAKISDELAEKIKQISIAVFNCLDAKGLARVDFFLKQNGEIVINEINTMPGFTSISMYPRLWEISGIKYPELIDKLIQLALEKTSLIL
jgi:D-alanine-D-alanine ligase